MTYDVHILIDDLSPEGVIINTIIKRDNVSPEEAVRRALRHPALNIRTAADEMIGAFSSTEDVELIDSVMEDVRSLRKVDRLCECGI